MAVPIGREHLPEFGDVAVHSDIRQLFRRAAVQTHSSLRIYKLTAAYKLQVTLCPNTVNTQQVDLIFNSTCLQKDLPVAASAGEPVCRHENQRCTAGSNAKHLREPQVIADQDADRNAGDRSVRQLCSFLEELVFLTIGKRVDFGVVQTGFAVWG